MITLFVTVIFIFFIIKFYSKSKSGRYKFEEQIKKCESPIELKLMNLLYENNMKPYTQISCGPYRIDIAVYKGKKKYAIECDGREFHSSAEQKAHDREKNRFLLKNNWHVIRLEGTHIYSNPNYCLRVIHERMNEK